MGPDTLIKPPRLRRGAVIGLIAPASPPVPAKIEAGVRYLEGLGYRVRLGAHVQRCHGCQADTDAERLADLNGMLRDPQVDAIFALRGGYGCQRLLPKVDYAAARRSPKIIAGYSDLTALQLALLRKAGLVTFSAPMPAVEFAGGVDPFTEADFWAALTSRAASGTLPLPADSSVRTLRPGVCDGPLIGCCLSLLASNLATPFLPSLKGALLFLEDVHEEPHRLDRLFVQLRNSGVLRRISGLMLGRFTDQGPRRVSPAHLPWTEMLDEVLAELRGPGLDGLPYGHVAHRWTLPLGIRARLNSARKRVTLLEPAVG